MASMTARGLTLLLEKTQSTSTTKSKTSMAQKTARPNSSRLDPSTALTKNSKVHPQRHCLTASILKIRCTTATSTEARVRSLPDQVVDSLESLPRRANSLLVSRGLSISRVTISNLTNSLICLTALMEQEAPHPLCTRLTAARDKCCHLLSLSRRPRKRRS